MKRLEGKVAIVTGGGQGIGQVMCETFAREGAEITVVDLNAKKAINVAKDICRSGGNAIGLKVDISKSIQVQEMVGTAMEKFGQIDILVNNAGVYSLYNTRNCPEEEWDRIFAVNVKGVFLCCRALMNHMVKRRSGKIINLSSLAAKSGGLNASPPYSASKAAVAVYTISLARELGPFGICVNAIAPGIIKSEMTRNHPKSLDASIALEGRRGNPEDVANAALFLASSESDYITGEILDVNGGIWMD